MATSGTEGRVTQIQQQCSEMEELCSTLHSAIGQLDECLIQVTRPAEVAIADQEGSKKERQELVPLAMFLRCRNETIQSAIDRLNGLRQRIEL